MGFNYLICKLRQGLFCLLFFCICRQAAGQSISPVLLNATGGSYLASGAIYEWSVGELALVETMINSNAVLTNGLLQPLHAYPSELGFNIIPNNILSPNGDGENDTWIIDGILNFTENEVTVFDRAGRIVFFTKNYQNEWTGNAAGVPLTQDTYYYIIKLKNGDQFGFKKGFVTIVR